MRLLAVFRALFQTGKLDQSIVVIPHRVVDVGDIIGRGFLIFVSDLLDPCEVAAGFFHLTGLQQRISQTERISLLLFGTQHVDIGFVEPENSFFIFTAFEMYGTDHVTDLVAMAGSWIFFQIVF